MLSGGSGDGGAVNGVVHYSGNVFVLTHGTLPILSFVVCCLKKSAEQTEKKTFFVAVGKKDNFSSFFLLFVLSSFCFYAYFSIA